MELGIRINKDRALEALRRFPELLGKNARLATKMSLRDIRVGAQRDHRFITRGGFAEKSISDEVNSNGLGGKVFLDTGIAHYAPYLHTGTRPFTIRPVHKQALRFVAGGQFVFARVVHHPGIRGDQFLFRSADRNEQKVVDNYNKAVERSIAEGGLK